MTKHFFNSRKTRSVIGLPFTAVIVLLVGMLALGVTVTRFQPAVAAQDDALRLKKKLAEDNQLPALHQPAAQVSEELFAAPQPSGHVIESDGGQTHCRTATEAEARALEQRNPALQLRAINHETTPGFAQVQTQDGLKIILRGTPQLEQFPVAKAAFIRAAQRWEAVIQSPITLIIDVDYGPTRFGEAYPDNIIGSTNSQTIGSPTVYPGFRAALIARASNAQEAALYNLLPPVQVPTDIGATTGIFGPSAVSRALGLIDPIANPDGERERFGPPPSIGFNSAFQFDFDPSNGIEPGKTDFDATVTHELGHALGFVSNAGYKELVPSAPILLSTWDFFRFRPGVTGNTFATAQRILSSGGEHIFFGSGPELALSTGRSDASGGDARQASHWKDDVYTGRYIGIMDPTLPAGRREEITENDLKALDLMGYQVRANPNPTPTPTPPPNQQTVELKLDDGSQELGAFANGLIVVNRLTPPSYPATLQKLRFIFWTFQNQPDPTGKPIAVVIFTDPSGAGQPPANATLTRINTTVPGTSLTTFFELNITNGPTINSGDFYVGYQSPSPHQGVGFFLDTSGQSPNRCFFSSNDGAGFSLLAPALQLNSANALIRAVVSVGGPTPTPTPPSTIPDTVALTSGVPQTGAITAPAPGGVVLGPTQYTIQVPSGATQLRVTLSGNQDVDLYARLGNRAELQQGRPIADFKSESETGNESITITPSSSPALQAGKYFIGIGNYGPGVANITVTATVTAGGGPTPTPTPNPTPPSGNRAVRIGQAGGAPGGQVSVPIELVSQGNENALGFSLTFDPAVLSNPQAALGGDAAGATLNTNNSQTGSGRLGLALALPSGQRFSAGTRQLALVTFTIAGGASGSSTPVGFGDQPIAREISDVNAGALQASYVAGAVSLAAGLEADVTPRPNGNGSVTITDWVQVGRFVAGLDTVAGGEFQRADCAPRETRGNGSLSITDWVQAGRYAAGLDAPTPAGGPSTQGLTTGSSSAKAALTTGTRNVRISSGYFERGQQSAVIVELGAEGNENALGFSLTFDPAQLRFVSAAVGRDTNGALLNVNTSRAAQGLVGVALALPAGQTLPAGVRQLAVINFGVAAEGGATTATIGFSDQPLRRELSDANANALPTSFSGGTVTLTRSVANVSAASFTGQALASEAMVAAFGQNLATQVAVAEDYPLPTSLAGTTVRVRDHAGEERLAPLFFVAPTQVNYQIPAGTASGTATVIITSSAGQISTGMLNITPVAPGLFSATSSGQGLATALVLRVKANGAQSYEAIARYDTAQNRFVALPIDLGAEGEQVFLIIYGTGFRHRSTLAAVKATLGEVETEVLFAGEVPRFAGLDQLNLRLPRSLAGRGVVELKLNVDGYESNRVQIQVR